jgi:NADPH:quinone reductase-like Zn-dependent oxidoreductase
VDGAGVLDDGRRVFVAFPRAPYGTMAEEVVIARDLYVEIPDDIDDVTAAAVGNPGMASWAALKDRARFVAGESVLINGATGVSGRFAITVARHLGAKRIVVTGRSKASEKALLALGADAYIPLDAPELESMFYEEVLERGIRVVLDFLWGASAERIISAIGKAGNRIPGQDIRFVQIGAMAGQIISLPGAALRSSGLELMGTGLGSVSNPRLVQVIGEVMRAFRSAGMKIEVEAMPMTDVEAAWHRNTPRRVVLTI